jgi:hypothetical protein
MTAIAMFLACMGEDATFAPTASPEAGGAAAIDAAATIDAGTTACGAHCVIAKNQTPREVAVDDTYVYWTSTQGVFRAPKSEPSRVVETLGTGTDAKGISLSSAYVFWITGGSCARIHRWSLATRAETTTSARIGVPMHTAFLDGNLFYSGQRGPTTCPDVDAGADGGVGGGVHVLDEDLADAGVMMFGAHPCATGGTTALAVGQPGAQDIAWTLQPPTDLCWMQNGTAAADATKGWPAAAITMRGQHLFVAAEDGVFDVVRADVVAVTKVSGEAATGLVYDSARERLFFVTRAGVVYGATGTTATTVAELGCAASSLAQDESALYVACEDKGTILRLIKP